MILKCKNCHNDFFTSKQLIEHKIAENHWKYDNVEFTSPNNLEEANKIAVQLLTDMKYALLEILNVNMISKLNLPHMDEICNEIIHFCNSGGLMEISFLQIDIYEIARKMRNLRFEWASTHDIDKIFKQSRELVEEIEEIIEVNF